MLERAPALTVTRGQVGAKPAAGDPLDGED
jgi:hypothetical protein